MIFLFYVPPPHKTMTISNKILKAGYISSINFQKSYLSLETQTLTFTLLLLFLKSPPQIIYKFQIMANKYSQLPFTRLIYFLYEAAPNPDAFVITIFEWVKSKGLLSPWIDHLIQDKSYNKLFTKYIDIYLRQS